MAVKRGKKMRQGVDQSEREGESKRGKGGLVSGGNEKKKKINDKQNK